MKRILATPRLHWLHVHGINQLSEAIARRLAEPVLARDLAGENLAQRIAEQLPFGPIYEALQECEAQQREHGEDAVLFTQQTIAVPPTLDDDGYVVQENPPVTVDADSFALADLLERLRGLAAQIEPFRKHITKSSRRAAA